MLSGRRCSVSVGIFESCFALFRGLIGRVWVAHFSVSFMSCCKLRVCGVSTCLGSMASPKICQGCPNERFQTTSQRTDRIAKKKAQSKKHLKTLKKDYKQSLNIPFFKDENEDR